MSNLLLLKNKEIPPILEKYFHRATTKKSKLGNSIEFYINSLKDVSGFNAWVTKYKKISCMVNFNTMLRLAKAHIKVRLSKKSMGKIKV